MPGVTPGIRPLAEPLRVGPGVIRAGFHAARQGMGEHERGGGLECAAEQIGRAGRLEAQGPPVLAAGADLGEFYLAPRLPARPDGARQDRHAGQREPADPPPLVHRPPAGRVAAAGGERADGKGPLLPGLQASAGAAGHLEVSRAAAVGLHLQRPAPADLHRQPGQLRIQQVGVLAGFRGGREPPEPSGHRSLQLAREDPAHLQAADCFGDQALRRFSSHRLLLLTLLAGSQ